MVLVPEWLSGMTRNHVGFARAGSNPAEHGFYVHLAFIFSVNITNAVFRKPRGLKSAEEKYTNFQQFFSSF